MPKGSRGGKTATSSTSNTVQQVIQQNQGQGIPNAQLNQGTFVFQQQQGIPLNEQGITIDQVRQMDDDNMSKFVLATLQQDLPDYLMSNNTQKFVYAVNANEKPLVEDTATFLKNTPQNQRIYNAQNGTDVNINGQYAFHLTGNDIHDYLKFGDDTLIQNGVYGNGIYFSNSQSGSASYGGVQSVARLNPATVKSVSFSQLRNEYQQWSQKMPKTAQALQKHATTNKGYGANAYSQFAMLKGYNVVYENVGGGQNYYVVINRNALVYAKDQKKSGTW